MYSCLPSWPQMLVGELCLPSRQQVLLDWQVFTSLCWPGSSLVAGLCDRLGAVHSPSRLRKLIEVSTPSAMRPRKPRDMSVGCHAKSVPAVIVAPLGFQEEQAETKHPSIWQGRTIHQGKGYAERCRSYEHMGSLCEQHASVCAAALSGCAVPLRSDWSMTRCRFMQRTVVIASATCGPL